MDKSSDSSTNQYLKNLNKLSHNISKPTIPTSKKTQLQSQSQSQPQSQPQPQPAVYNINKNDFRDVVQKLTGSPAHERFSTPLPVQPSPKPPSSRLHRIRPPPLAQVTNRPPSLVNTAVPPQPGPPPLNNTAINPPMPAATMPNTFAQRPSPPVSPFPPFSAVHGAAESPVSAYMRHLQNSIFNVDASQQFSGFSPLPPPISPRWNNLTPQQPPLQHNQKPIVPPQTSGTMTSQPQFQFPTSPLPFWGLNSPRSPHPLFSPGLLLSPSAFPVSPTWPVASPGWRGL